VITYGTFQIQENLKRNIQIGNKKFQLEELLMN